MKRLPGPAACAALLMAALACNFPGGTSLNANATVAALSTAIRATTSAQTQAAAGGVSAATFTPPPGIDTAPPPPAADTPVPAPTAELRRPLGEVLHAAPVTLPIEINGDVSEWGRLPFTANQPVYKPAAWSGPQDQAVEFALGWDSGYLYLAANVTDDVHAQTQHGELIFRGDILEILLDKDLAGDFDSTALSADDYQLGLSPGALSGDSPEAYLWFPAGKAGKPAGVVLAARQAGAGYSLEAAIPWSLFGLTPGGGLRLGFAVSGSDNDALGTADQQSMISSAPARKLADPTTWGTLVLDN
jgi:hypothetical protein